MNLIRRIPLPASALALGSAALGNLLLPYSPVARAVCGVLAAVLVLLITARIALDLTGVRAEMANPAVFTGFPAFFMALMLLATYLKPYAAVAATALWWAALAAQLMFVGVFAVRYLVSFKLAQVVPGWFLVFVGFVVGSVTSPAFGAVALGRVLLYAGALGYVVALALVVYRLVKLGDPPAPALPTLAIFAAPPSLLLAGYLSVAATKSPGVVYALLAVAGASLVYVVARLPRILSGGFYPSFGALTFPVVICAIALKLSNAFLATTPAGSFVPKVAIMAMDGFAAAMVAYVLVRYAMWLLAPAPEPSAAVASARA